MHDRFYEHQSAGLDQAALEGHAQALGLDLARFRTALADGRHDAAIDADISIAKQASINGTPAFVINGYLLSGAQPVVAFKRIIKRVTAEKKRPPKAAK